MTYTYTEEEFYHMEFSDADEGDVHHCMRCKYTGDDWAQHDDFKNEDESNERLCPKCYAQSYFMASDEELRLYPQNKERRNNI